MDDSNLRYVSNHGLITPPSSPSKKAFYTLNRDETSNRLATSAFAQPRRNRRSSSSARIDVCGILAPQKSPEKDKNARSLRSPPTLSQNDSRTSRPGTPGTPSRHSISSSENEFPFTPGAPRKDKNTSKFMQSLPPPKFSLPVDGASDEGVVKEQASVTSQSSSDSNHSLKQDVTLDTKEVVLHLPVCSSPERAGLTSANGSPFELPSPDMFDDPTPEASASQAISYFSTEDGCSPADRLSSSFLSVFFGSRGRRASDGSLGNQRSPSQSLDRFIPSWRPSAERRDSYHMSKPVDRLTHSEKISRQAGFGPDPFGRRPRNTPQGLRHRHSLPYPLASSSNGLRQARNAPNHPASTSISPIRQISMGAVWNISEIAAARGGSVMGVEDGHGGMLSSGTNAPLYCSNFLSTSNSEYDADIHERRLALALEVDPAERLLGTTPPSEVRSPSSLPNTPTPKRGDVLLDQTSILRGGAASWRDGQWHTDGAHVFLDAPSLRDDYYTTLLSYSATLDVLAVGLGTNVHLWSEARGVDTPELLNALSTAHVTSLSFSSVFGAQAILATGRVNGKVSLWSPLEAEPRFDIEQPSPISCLCFSPRPRRGPSHRDQLLIVDKEDLLVGDETGLVYYWTVEWPSALQRDLFDFAGAMTLVAKLDCHSQQICGLAWSPNADYFASGGNDNVCILFKARSVQEHPGPSRISQPYWPGRDTERTIIMPGLAPTLQIANAKQIWGLKAAVKAIAFSPHHRSLLALGGGSNDRQIHFVHILSGAVLARIDCCAQITGLLWSKTRREICATFGFAQPDHPVRVAVFAWPNCEQLVAIPWPDEHRALWAVSYPGGPSDGTIPRVERRDGGPSRVNEHPRTPCGRQSRWLNRVKTEGCVIIATSDASIKFHEVWPEERRRRTAEGERHLGGSAILEGDFGKPEVIR